MKQSGVIRVESTSAAPRYTTEQVREIVEREWERVLGVLPTDVDNFFDLGGDSLMAVKVTGRLRPALGVQLKLSALLGHPVFDDYVTHVLKVWADLLVNNSPVRVPRDGRLPLPFVVEQLVLNELKSLQESTPPTSLPLTLVALSIPSVNSSAAIAQALDQVIARHETLRVKVDLDVSAGRAGLSFDDTMDWRLPIQECGDLVGQARTDFLVREKTAMLLERVDLAHAPLWHAKLYDFAQGDRVLMLAIDHIIIDGRSVGFVVSDLAAALSGTLEAAADDRLDFFDWGAWQRAQLSGPAHENLIRFWSAELEGIGPHPDLAAPRPTQETTEVWYETGYRLVNEDTAALMANRESGTAALETLLAAIALAWRRVQGQYESVVWLPTGDRIDPAFDGVVGAFAHALPVRISVPDDDARSALETAGKALLRTLTHQELPTPELLRALEPESRLGRRPGRLFLGVGLRSQREFEVPGGTMRRFFLPTPVHTAAQPGISFYVNIEDGGFGLALAVDPREIDVDFVDTLLGELVKSLTELCALAARSAASRD